MKFEDLKVGQRIKYIEKYNRPEYANFYGTITEIKNNEDFYIKWDSSNISQLWTFRPEMTSFLDFKTPEYMKDFEEILK
jgi:hypothetical protein